MCKEKLQGTRAKGNPHFGKSVSSTMTLTGKIEDKPLNTSRRKRTVTSVEWAPGSWVLFCCLSPAGSPSTAEAPQPCTPRDKVRLPNTAMVTGAVAHCFTFFEEDSPVLLRLASNSWAQVIILLAPSFLEQ